MAGLKVNMSFDHRNPGRAISSCLADYAADLRTPKAFNAAPSPKAGGGAPD
jgi:hypothetical protein